MLFTAASPLKDLYLHEERERLEHKSHYLSTISGKMADRQTSKHETQMAVTDAYEQLQTVSTVLVFFTDKGTSVMDLGPVSWRATVCRRIDCSSCDS